jgi:hypothetical protein
MLSRVLPSAKSAKYPGQKKLFMIQMTEAIGLQREPNTKNYGVQQWVMLSRPQEISYINTAPMRKICLTSKLKQL